MTASTSPNNTLHVLMKDVSEAIRLDRGEKNDDAYRKYLECVLRVSTALLKDLHSDEGHVRMTNDKLKMVKLGQQCMDRVSLIINGRFVQPPTVQGKTSQSETGPPTSLPISSTASNSREATPSPSQSLTQITSPVFCKTSADRGPVTLTKSMNRQKKISPMEVAAQQNQQLLSAFKARQKLAEQGRNKRTVSVNLSLTLQRKMAENLAIAKAQEEILAKKMKERQQRLEEQAAKRFHTPMGLSEEEQQQRRIFRKVLEFEQEELWMIDERKKLEESPTDLSVISHLVTAILKCDSHPLTEQIRIYQNKLLKKVYAIIDGKMDRVNRIQVPLDRSCVEDLKPFILTSPKSAIEKVRSPDALDGKMEIKEDSSVNLPDAEGNVTNDRAKNDDASELDNTNVESSTPEAAADNIEEKSGVEHDDDIESVTIEIKDEIKSAIEKAEDLRVELNEDDKAFKSMCKQVTEDYDKYNQENMDELFESDSDNDDGECPNKSKSVDDAREHVGDNEPQSDEEKKELEEELESCLSNQDNFVDSDGLVARLKNEAYLRHLKGISEDILTSIEKVQVLFVIAFQELDSAEGKDQCNVILEGFFFRPLWNALLILFRLANEPKELAIALYMTDKQASLPCEFGVRDKLSLTPSVGNEEFPYQSSVKELAGITKCPTMLEKLDCLVRTSKMVMQNVEQYYKQTDTQLPDIGADDLLPILCYVVARSGLPQIVSECHAMDRFIHEGYMFGEEGYCLTSFQTAINYLVSKGMENI